MIKLEITDHGPLGELLLAQTSGSNTSRVVSINSFLTSVSTSEKEILRTQEAALSPGSLGPRGHGLQGLPERRHDPEWGRSRAQLRT